MADPGDRQRRAPRARSRARPLARVDAAAQTRAGGDPEGLGEVARREVLLVARQLEAGHVRVRALGRVARHAQRPLDAEVAYAVNRMRRLDAVLGPGVVDAAGDAVEVLLVAQPDSAAWSGEAMSST